MSTACSGQCHYVLLLFFVSNSHLRAVQSESQSVVVGQRVRCSVQRVPVFLLYVVSNVPLRAVSSESQSVVRRQRVRGSVIMFSFSFS